MKFVVMTRKPQEGRNNWLIASQDGEWRNVLWGSGKIDLNGAKVEKVDSPIEEFVMHREHHGYVLQAELMLYIPASVIMSFIDKHLPAVLKAYIETKQVLNDAC